VKETEFDDVAWTGLRFVAIGTTTTLGDSFLDSTGGSIWHRQSRHGADSHASRIAAGPGGVVAVGVIGDQPAGWFSPDGLSWTAHRNAFPIPNVGDKAITVTDVVARGTGWLAVGREDPLCYLDCGTSPVRAFVWTSSNGFHWTRVATQAAFKGVGLVAVSRDRDGFVAVGTAAGHGAILTSRDGLTWSRVPDGPMFGSRAWGRTGLAAATAVAADDRSVVVLGMVYDEPGRVIAWWSADGRTWSKAAVDKAMDGQVFGAATTPVGFVATGPSGPDSCLGGIWSSANGRRWRCDAAARGFEGFGPSAAAANDAVVVAVGLTSAGWAETSSKGMPGAAWVRKLR
jgi:hypothetical protein